MMVVWLRRKTVADYLPSPVNAAGRQFQPILSNVNKRIKQILQPPLVKDCWLVPYHPHHHYRSGPTQGNMSKVFACSKRLQPSVYQNLDTKVSIKVVFLRKYC